MKTSYNFVADIKQHKKRYMNIDDIRSEKQKLQIVIDEAIRSFKRKTGCNVAIKSKIVEDRSKSPYGDKFIFCDEHTCKTKIHIDVIIN
jgi:hypothetical protein